MLEQKEIKDTGLRGVLVADTYISSIDGIKGELSYRGYDIHDLAEYSTSEEVAYLLLYGNLPNPSELDRFSKKLMVERKIPEGILNYMAQIPKNSSPMDVLQATTALLSGFDSENSDDSKDANTQRAIKLIAKTPTFVASWHRIRQGLSPIEPKPDLNRASNFLYMLKGEIVDNDTAEDFDTCLLIHAEHSFNASAFTARVVASTRAHMYAAISAATGALSGELHGGANTQVMRNLEEIGDPKKVEAWVKQEFDRHERVMGMGHAVYRTIDPRAEILKHISEKLARRTGDPKWFLITEEIEEATKKEFRNRKKADIYPNVDLYTASVYHMMGIPTDLFTPVFAIARILGWTAHVLEEKFPRPPIKPELYRPNAEYRGHYCGPVGCKYLPLEKRNVTPEIEMSQPN